MTVYTVGEEGASVFDTDGHLLARLRPGATVVPGTLADTVEPRAADQERPLRRMPTMGPLGDAASPRGYDDKVIRPEHC